MGGRTAKTIVGAIFIGCGLLVIAIGFISVGLGVEEWPYVVLAGFAMAGIGLFMLLDDTWVCRNCGSRNKEEAIACRYCGSSQHGTKKPSTTEVRSRGDKFCPNCGSTLPVGAKFCEKCGARMEDYIPGSGPRTEE